ALEKSSKEHNEALIIGACAKTDYQALAEAAPVARPPLLFVPSLRSGIMRVWRIGPNSDYGPCSVSLRRPHLSCCCLCRIPSKSAPRFTFDWLTKVAPDSWDRRRGPANVMNAALTMKRAPTATETSICPLSRRRRA